MLYFRDSSINTMNIHAAILTIGDEILYGQITDTNAQWLAAALSDAGIKLRRKITVGDSREEILAGFEEAQRNADIIITTGGLGPTKDDITKKVFAEFFGTEMTFRPEVLANIERLFSLRNRTVNDLNKTQAWIPANGEIITNEVGTAPGMWFSHQGKVFISMPGVPHEMKKMMAEVAIPRLKQTFDVPYIYHRMIKTVGVPESTLAEVINDWEDSLPPFIKLAYLPKLGQVRLRLTAMGTDRALLEAAVAEEVEKVKPLIGKWVYAYDEEEIEHTIGQMLLSRGQHLATAESCTGGLIADRITDLAGCSAYYKGGIVAYSNDVKISQLGVKAETIVAHGAVSEQTAMEMAEQVRLRYGADYGIATTGVAGPGGGTPEKPVGTVWIGYSDAHKTFAKKYMLVHDRMMNIQFAYNLAMNLLRLQLLGEEPL
jgi:nicotinamide-nucleotide amidase